jgi:formamidase
MPEVVFPLDSQKKFTEQQIVGHNRWHPDIPAQVHVKPGDSFRVHCREWFDGASFLTEQFPDAYKVIWDFRGGVATSRHVPGVSFTGIVHPGLMGTAPSAELLATWNAREQALIDTDPDRVPPLALPPNPDSAILGSLTGDDFTRAAAEAARTAPPRENGGNQDIKNLTKGSRVFYPVFVDGAKLSMGDLHFSQGDGEITFCGAIEMGGFMDLHVDVIKGGMATYGVSENAIFMPGNVDPRYDQWLAFSGTSVTLSGEQRYLDSHLSYQRACLHAITTCRSSATATSRRT